MGDPYKTLAERLLIDLMDVTSAYSKKFVDMEGATEPMPTPHGRRLPHLPAHHPLMRSGRIKTTISNASADEL